MPAGMEKLTGPKVRFGDGLHGGGYTAQDIKESNDLIAAGYVHVAVDNLISEGHLRSGRSAKSFGIHDGTITLPPGCLSAAACQFALGVARVGAHH